MWGSWECRDKPGSRRDIFADQREMTNGAIALRSLLPPSPGILLYVLPVLKRHYRPCHDPWIRSIRPRGSGGLPTTYAGSTGPITMKRVFIERICR